jgi:hypothetical protein
MTRIQSNTRSSNKVPVAALFALEGEPAAFEYRDDGDVSVSLTTATGETVKLTMTGPAFLRSIGIAGKFYSAHAMDIISDNKLI